ncbi:MAG: acetyltransferase [Candidatus Omnitrophica bacterium]|nr:acetyltransferase [Candidatus Omnitrophota bacterium]
MQRKNKIVIFGAGGHGKVILDILLEKKEKVLGFLDDDKNKIGLKINGYRVLGDLTYLKRKKSINLALGVGNNRIREMIYRKAKGLSINIISAIHPKAVVSKEAKIGRGVAIMAGAVVNTCVVIEDGAVVNTSASVDHDCHLGKFCQIWPGAHLAGNIKVGEFSYVGTGASVIQNITIGKNAMIGAGAVVIDNIADCVTVVGVPARIIKNHKNEK